jgi:hypothetical protein
MKRTVNKVPLESVLSLMYGFTRIVIEDRKNKDIYMDNAPDTERWEGFVNEIWDAPDKIRYKWMKSKVHQIWHTEKYLLLIISTEFEEY